MIESVEEYNNGYRCGCCSRGSYDELEINASEMISFELMLDFALDYRRNIDGRISLNYYENDKSLYGYNTYFGKHWTEVFVTIEGVEYLAFGDRTDATVFTKEEILDLWNIAKKKNERLIELSDKKKKLYTSSYGLIAKDNGQEYIASELPTIYFNHKIFEDIENVKLVDDSDDETILTGDIYIVNWQDESKK